jgi:hypothetical protein
MKGKKEKEKYSNEILERIKELANEGFNITKASEIICDEFDIKYSDSFRRRMSSCLKRNDIKKKPREYDNDLENETTTDTSQYKSDLSNMPSAWSSEKKRFYSIEEYCDVYGLDKNSVKSSKLVSHNASHMVYNIAFFTDEEEAVIEVGENLEEIIQKYINPIKIETSPTVVSEYFDRLVYTDTHIAMNVQGKDGDPLYDGKWDEEEVLSRLSSMITHVKTFKSSNFLIIDDLGDFMDGLGGQTTRKGHELPQNMNDKEAFDLALTFKLALVDALVLEYDEIICNNITNDNHSGVFSYFVSSAVKGILEQRYPGVVKVNSIKRFMHHYSVHNHTFVISHGKDIGENKFGFKPKLDAVQAEKIDQYCKEHKLYNGNFIEFSKGDSHQAIYDDATSNDFSYYNYPAFSPPSNWVKTNFSNSRSGFNFFNISKDKNIKVSIPYWFDKHKQL